MIIIEKNDAEFIKKNIPNPEKIIEASSLREALLYFLDWLDNNRGCWDSSGFGYSVLGSQAQRVYDNIRISNGSVETA